MISLDCMKDIIFTITGLSFIISIGIVFYFFLKKDSTNTSTKIILVFFTGSLFLATFMTTYLEKSEGVFKAAGMELSFKGENFKIKNTSTEKPASFVVSASSTTSSPPAEVSFNDRKYLTKESKGADGTRFYYFDKLPPTKELEGSSAPGVRLTVFTSSSDSDWGRMWDTNKR